MKNVMFVAFVILAKGWRRNNKPRLGLPIPPRCRRVNRRRIGLGVGHKILYLVLGETNLGPNNHTGNELRHGGDVRAFAQTGELCESTAPSAQIPSVVWWINNI